MPILKVDSMGNLYTSSPDREDGGGYGESPECQSQGDVTLGSAYLKAGAERTRSLLKSRQDQQWLDNHDMRMKEIGRANRQIKLRNDQAIDMMSRNPKVKEAVTKQALAMGCPCEYSTPMSGNVMTANGQSGWAGMSRDQQTIHNAITGMGMDTSFGVDPVENEQYRHKIQADRLLRLKARR